METVPARKATLSVVVMVSVLPGASMAAGDSIYAGIAVGATRESGDFVDQVERARATDPAPPTDIRLDTDSRAAGRIFAGIALTSNFAVEADYSDLGGLHSHVMWHGTPPFYQFERFGQIDVRAVSLSLVGAAPLSARLSVFGRAGAAFTRVDYKTTGTVFVLPPNGGTPATSASPTPPTETVRQTRPVLALGLDYRVTDRWSVRGEWSRYFGVGNDYGTPNYYDERGKFDLDVASVGLTYRF
jgi:opacity protein-like surface antigen